MLVTRYAVLRTGGTLSSKRVSIAQRRSSRTNPSALRVIGGHSIFVSEHVPRSRHPPSNTNSNSDTDSLTPSNTSLAHGFAGGVRPSCYVRAVRIIRILFVAVAVLAVIARYLRERRRIAIVERLSGREGLAYLERTRSGGDRFDLIVTIVLAAGACASLVALAAAVA